ncbi:hypothetical protein PCANC_09783 [Puccinia coronata f. sp. avenae]|uniref:Uncharacterized protein n=1 Tax=Puccinia coronata f. sp. avenae TaxID=200324 RepID=A0A2N5VM22_9BASI|nr:hypothetical protein PCANC_22515 [Puccinia coronata f. sp. avenae]PLW51038.1 hypothetical protein PCASD_02408 [Puccinia coronata f. sp. avenae]PLW53189.1 hypothetical protein PCANC_09783 [Puccinia coronata f. sp. avenae]
MSVQADTQKGPNNEFHILPVVDPKPDETPSLLAGNPGLQDGGAVVTTQPGPVIIGDQLSGVPVKSSEELDQQAALLNKPDAVDGTKPPTHT